MLNIPSTVVDPKYRYRMPKMVVKIESKGNGIKTNIVNLGDVALHLRTNEQYILKFFGFQKASSTTFKEAGGKNNTNYIINGDFSEQDLRKVLDKFIEKYICCPKCKLPEMHMSVIGQKINGKCDSCPFVGELDSKHSLAKFIIKNPPQAKNMATGKVVKVETDKTPTLEKKEDKKKEEKNKKDELLQETTVSFDTNNMDFGSPELQKFVDYIKTELQTLKNEDFDIKCAKIVSKIKPLNLKKPLIAYSLFNAFFTVNISQQVAESAKFYLALVKKLVVTNTELETLLNIEYLFLEANKEKDFTKFLPTILFNIVKEDLLSESFLKEWSKQQIKDIENCFLYNSNRDAEFKKAVQPYLDSLEDEEEEEEELQEKPQGVIAS